MKEDISNTNDKGEYQEWYWDNDELYYRGTFKNLKLIGYEEWHRVKQTTFYIR